MSRAPDSMPGSLPEESVQTDWMAPEPGDEPEIEFTGNFKTKKKGPNPTNSDSISNDLN